MHRVSRVKYHLGTILTYFPPIIKKLVYKNDRGLQKILTTWLSVFNWSKIIVIMGIVMAI